MFNKVKMKIVLNLSKHVKSDLFSRIISEI